ncbi:MAG: aldehyde reductase [Microlunatus sp.]
MADRVLVTGGNGFVAAWCIVRALEQGFHVRTTVRSLSKEPRLRSILARAGDAGDRLEVVVADLTSDSGWAEAVAGCSYVLHVASPMIATRRPEEVIRPAVEGVHRVLRAARDGGVRRVVYTSSCGAIYYGHPAQTEPFDETSWTNLEASNMSLYVRSKTLAERAAWDFIAAEGGSLELVTVNPTGIFGPALDPENASSLDLIRRLLDGSPPATPNLWFGVIDVRDVADLHLRAMTDPDAAGQRYIASSGNAVSMLDIARVLREQLGPQAAKVPTRALPDWLVRLVGRFNTEVGDVVPLLGQRRNATSAKAQRELGWSARPWSETVVDSARSLLP